MRSSEVVTTVVVSSSSDNFLTNLFLAWLNIWFQKIFIYKTTWETIYSLNNNEVKYKILNICYVTKIIKDGKNLFLFV